MSSFTINNNIPALHLAISNDYDTLFTIQRLHILRNSQVNNLSSESQMKQSSDFWLWDKICLSFILRKENGDKRVCRIVLFYG